MFMNMIDGSAVASSPSQLMRTPMPTKLRAALMNPSGRKSHMKMSVVTTLDDTWQVPRDPEEAPERDLPIEDRGHHETDERLRRDHDRRVGRDIADRVQE